MESLFVTIYRLYKQMDGFAVGSPLGPTLANFFLGHIEKQLHNNSTIDKPKLFERHIDAIFVVFDDDQTCERFLNILTSQDQSLKSTIEKATQSLCFPDVEINIFRKWCRKFSMTRIISYGTFLNLMLFVLKMEIRFNYVFVAKS